MIASTRIATTAMVMAALGACAGRSDLASYRPTVLQNKVDRSFSTIPIETPLEEARPMLAKIVENGCDANAECDWQDRQGVRHYFWGERPDRLVLVVKSVKASEFEKRSIPALGIGAERQRFPVLRAIRAFAPDLSLECDKSRCQTSLKPGWVTVTFDNAGLLTEVRLDGYHFT